MDWCSSSRKCLWYVLGYIPILFCYRIKNEFIISLYILSVNEKPPFLKCRYFENYKKIPDSYFTFRVSGQLHTRLEQRNRSSSPVTREQLLHMHFVLFAVYQTVKILFSKTNVPEYAGKIFLENAIKMVSIISSNRASEAQTFRNYHRLASSHRSQWKHLVSINEKVPCIHV